MRGCEHHCDLGKLFNGLQQWDIPCIGGMLTNGAYAVSSKSSSYHSSMSQSYLSCQSRGCVTAT